MTRKDYVAIARAIRETREDNPKTANFMLTCLTGRLCRVFAEDNDRFDSTRFLAATLPTDS